MTRSTRRGRSLRRPEVKKWFSVCMLVALVGLALSAEGCSTPTSTRRNGATAKRTPTSTTPQLLWPFPTTTTPVASTPTTVAPSALSLLAEPQAGMTPLYDFMSSARKSLDMTMYELADPTAEQILIADHKRGVQVGSCSIATTAGLGQPGGVRHAVRCRRAGGLGQRLGDLPPKDHHRRRR